MLKYLFFTAARNLQRNRLRTLVSIIAIALSVTLIIVLRGYVLGIVDSMLSLHIQYDSGHIKVMDTEYRKKERLLSLNNPVDGFDGEGLGKMVDELGKITEVERVVPRLKFGAATPVDDELKGLLGWGVRGEDEIAFTDIDRYIVEGRMVKEGEKEIVIGARMLEELGLNVGDNLTILFTTSFGSFKGLTFKIVGKIESNLKLLDEYLFYVPLDVAQNMLEMPDMATELLLVTPDYNKVDNYLNEVKDVFAQKDGKGRYSILPWYKTNPLISFTSIIDDIYNIIYVLLVLLGSFVVINTMLMIVKERTQEIGMMTALGLTSRDILQMFIMEGMVIGIIGSLVGGVFGGVGTKILSIVGLDYSEAFAGIGVDILIPSVYYAVFSPGNIIFCILLGIVITTLACIIPARKAAKLEPTEALRR